MENGRQRDEWDERVKMNLIVKQKRTRIGKVVKNYKS